MKIGVIGTIGYGLEYSIAASKVSDYEFAYPVPIIEEYAIHLRTVEECDIVIWVGHDSGNINDDLVALSGDASLDALFNAHSHNEYADTTEDIPQVQSGAVGEYVGHVRLNLNDDNEVISYTAENDSLYSDANFFSEYQPVQLLIAAYIDETAPLFSAPIITSGENLSSYDLSLWLTKLLVSSTGADIAFQNSGGTRTDISNNEIITLATLYEVWPFDNVIKTVYLDGAIINNLKATSLIYYTEVTEFEAGVLYKVATNDYVFDKDNAFLNGEQIEYTGIILRDLVEQELLDQALVYEKFFYANEIQTLE
jgi:2',3'-cyclic-nucleotide 2'-phosphodiesterase (5'-nucleotidase family)